MLQRRRAANLGPRHDAARAAARRLHPPGSALLLLATLVAAASLGLAWSAGNAIYCDRLPPLTVLAALAAALLALGFHGLASATRRQLLLAALALAAMSLFVSVRFVARYRSPCAALEQQLHRQRTAP